MCRLTRREKWITPFTKQCFAVSSVVLNMISHGMTSGYNASLFSELRKTREIPLDVDSESWLASLIGVTLLVGSVVNSFVMEIIGRKPAILLSSVLTICGWISFSLASSFPALLIGKIFQGISVGIGGSVGSILIGEYTSPRYRGPFIAAVPTAILVGILISHTFGMSYGWHDLSSVLLFFSLPGLIVTVFSPESPSFLVTKGRYDECRKVFRWLRGTDEDNELETMIETDKILKKTKRAYTASLIGLSLCVGSIVCSLIMEIIGRKPAIIMSSVFTICGWISFSLASTFPVLLIGKIVQGISVGIGTTMGCILVAEYSSPKYRGSFIAAMPPAMLIGGLIAHSFGLFYGWHDLSTILIFFSLPGLIVAVLSPESPSYLVVKGRYDECRKVFRWLREKSEDDEVEAMIKTHMILKQSKKNQELNFFKLIKIKFIYVVTAVKKRECRIPIIIMMHLSAINQFCGSIVQEMYALDIHNALYGTDTYMFKVITSLDLQRIIATVSAIYITSKLKRRSMLLIFVALTVIANVCIAGYIYARHHDLVWLDHMAIGIFLHHFHTFVIGTGCLPLAFIIGGEIYPLADKGFCVTICNVLSAAYMFVNIKSAPYLFTLIGVDGAYCLNALILVYSLIVIMVMLPETKNRTLQEIEDEFRGFAVVGNHEDAFDLRCNEIEDNENL